MRLFAGINRRLITPKPGARLHGYSDDIYSESVNDDLRVTAILFKYDKKQIMLIVAEVCTIDTDLSDRIRTRISKELNIDINAIILCATHTHTGPCTSGSPGWGSRDDEYCNSVFIPQTLKAAHGAAKDIKPVTMGIGITDSYVGINRREQNIDNNILLGQNPWGCFDKQMTVIAFRHEGIPYFNLVHYACHGTSAGIHTEISRDWPGVMLDRLETETGAISIFLQGAEGDVGPRLSNGKTAGDLKYMTELGSIAAYDALKAYHNIHTFYSPVLDCVSGKIKIPYKKRMARSEAEASLKSALSQCHSNMNDKRCHYLKMIVDSYINGDSDLDAESIKQTIIKLGEIILIPSSYELFSEIALRLKEYANKNTILTLSCSNGIRGYFPSKRELALGGYEIEAFRMGSLQEYADDADKHYISGNLSIINKLKSQIE